MQQMRLTRSLMGLLAFGLSLMPIAALADVAALFAELDGAPPNRGLAQMMVIGIAEGFDTVNDQLKASQHPGLYCSPDKLNGDQLVDILRKWVKANPPLRAYAAEFFFASGRPKSLPDGNTSAAAADIGLSRKESRGSIIFTGAVGWPPRQGCMVRSAAAGAYLLAASLCAEVLGAGFRHESSIRSNRLRRRVAL